MPTHLPTAESKYFLLEGCTFENAWFEGITFIGADRLAATSLSGCKCYDTEDKAWEQAAPYLLPKDQMQQFYGHLEDEVGMEPLKFYLFPRSIILEGLFYTEQEMDAALNQI